jgi:hypothetical protein
MSSNPDLGTAGLVRMSAVRAPSYDPRDFIAICNHSLATLLGILGAVAAQVLYATRKESAND